MGEINVAALRLKIDPVGGLLPPVSGLLPIGTSAEVVISEARSDVNCR
ncbi:MAG: hypothetical protein ACR2KU_13860 [Gammaproteobacteria bacterium]|nr:hypothetical protein [Gammaproteobacteria bacterium]